MSFRTSRGPRPPALICAAALFVAAHASGARAGVTLTPSLSLEGKWDSNVVNTSSGEVSDTYFRAAPGLALSVDAYNTTVGIKSGFEIYRYAKSKELDSSSVTRDFSLTTAQSLRITPRFFLLPSARFLQTDDSVRRNQLMDAPVPGLPPSEAIVTPRRKERDILGALSAMYLISPQYELTVTGGWTKKDFLDPSPAIPLVSSTSTSEGISLVYRTSPRFSLGIFSNASQDRYETKPDSQTYAGGLDVRYQPADKFFVDAKAGASFARQSGDNTASSVDNWGPYGKFSATNTWQRMRAALSGYFGYTGGGSFGTPSYRVDTSLSLGYQITVRWSWDTRGYYQWNRPAGESMGRRVATTGGSTGLRYRMADWASLSLSGDATKQRSNAIAGADITRYSATLGLNLAYPIPIF